MKKKRDDYDICITPLIVWETMIANYMDENAQRNNDEENPWADMSARWDNSGVYEMRADAIKLGPWIDAIFDELDRKLAKDGGEVLPVIGMDAFDWEFVPAVLRHVDWKGGEWHLTLPPPKDIAAVLIAEHALKKGKAA